MIPVQFPGYARDTFSARWAFVIGYLLFVTFRDHHKGNLWFVIQPLCGVFVTCNWNLFRARVPIVHDDQGTYHQHCSEFSQDPQEFREKGAVSPFDKLSSGVRKMKVNKQDADKLHNIGSHFEMKLQCRFNCYSAYKWRKKLPRNPRREHSWFVIVMNYKLSVKTIYI